MEAMKHWPKLAGLPSVFKVCWGQRQCSSRLCKVDVARPREWDLSLLGKSPKTQKLVLLISHGQEPFLRLTRQSLWKLQTPRWKYSTPVDSP